MRFILGNNNVITEDASGVVLINCNDQTITSANNDTTIFNSGAATIDQNGLIECIPAPKWINITGGTTGTAGYDECIYYLDATLGNINLTIVHTNAPKTFVRLDSSVNTVTLTPESGTINGAANYVMTTQYEKITVLSFNSNLYF